MAYVHGAYGEITISKMKPADKSDTAVLYIGTAPVNLIKGYAGKDLINVPIKLSNMLDAQEKLGYSDDWESYTLCEAMSQHFENELGNVGPIYVINVLNPATHRATTVKTKTVNFKGGVAKFESKTIILDTLVIAEMVADTDFSVSYDFSTGRVTITSLDKNEPITGDMAVSYSEISRAAVTAADVIGQATSAGSYSGLAAISLMYQRENVFPNIIAAPGFSEIPSVYAAMVNAARKINGHFDAFVLADIPLANNGALIDNISAALSWKNANGYNSEFSKVFWPAVSNKDGQKLHLSTVAAATIQRIDRDHDGVPFESPSNKPIPAVKQQFADTSVNKGFDQHTANQLNESGVTTAVFIGGQWVLWGSHTAAFNYGGDMDARSIFDSSIRMLMHVTNGFQLRNSAKVDEPMNQNLVDTIINAEQEILDGYSAMGALVGSPEVLFVNSEENSEDILNGDFIFNINVTTTVPFKSGTVRVTFTDEGFSSYYGGEE